MPKFTITTPLPSHQGSTFLPRIESDVLEWDEPAESDSDGEEPSINSIILSSDTKSDGEDTLLGRLPDVDDEDSIDGEFDGSERPDFSGVDADNLPIHNREDTTQIEDEIADFDDVTTTFAAGGDDEEVLYDGNKAPPQFYGDAMKPSTSSSPKKQPTTLRSLPAGQGGTEVCTLDIEETRIPIDLVELILSMQQRASLLSLRIRHSVEEHYKDTRASRQFDVGDTPVAHPHEDLSHTVVSGDLTV
ncbi:hypothetical protein PG995_014201 [Apiospora arundinis]